jgi:hypothetical protein
MPSVIDSTDNAAADADASQRWTAADRAAAVARVSAYFRSLGVAADRRVADAADEVVAAAAVDHPDVPGGQLAQAAMDEARRRVRLWLARLVELGLLPEPTTRTAGLIVWRLRPALQRHPEAFLAEHNLPLAFTAAVGGPAPTILPETLPGQMDSQPIELRAIRLPARLTNPIRALGDLTHDLVLHVVGR